MRGISSQLVFVTSASSSHVARSDGGVQLGGCTKFTGANFELNQ